MQNPEQQEPEHISPVNPVAPVIVALFFLIVGIELLFQLPKHHH